MLVARRFVVRGRVQGVGFRYFAAEAAGVEGLSGWVRNRDDGAVEVSVEGDAESVVRFERKIRRGPPAARVDDVLVEDGAPSGRLGGFRIET
jgi:acylphosphatase